jgi:hypothetical protein
MPSGARTGDYLKNPVVQYGHNYRDPWATVGKTTELTVTTYAINAKFKLRPAANEHDPQNIVKLLWAGEWIRTASIGFMPEYDQIEENDFGGVDYHVWDLLEWSLVPVPANQEALRLAIKMLDKQKQPQSTHRIQRAGIEKYWEVPPDLGMDLALPAFDMDATKRLYVVQLPEAIARSWGTGGVEDASKVTGGDVAGKAQPAIPDNKSKSGAGTDTEPSTNATADTDANNQPQNGNGQESPNLLPAFEILLDTLKELAVGD